MVLVQQETLKREVNDLTNILDAKKVEIATVMSELQKVISSVPGTSQDNEEVLIKLRNENKLLQAKNTSLSEEIQTFNKQLIKAHKDANERLLCRMHTFNHIPPLS